MKKLLLVIPARYASSRFPGKPLTMIAGKSMLQRVWEQAQKTKGFDTKTIIATDDEHIYTAAQAFGAEVLLTSPEHQSGTDRCFEVARKTTAFDFDILVNIQGDEPFIQPQQIEVLATRLLDSASQTGTLKRRIDNPAEVINPNIVKVVCDFADNALYFSRSPIPYNRDLFSDTLYFRHLGIYAFKKEVVEQIRNLTPSSLEKTEKLEQLRWLENGHSVLVIETDFQSPAVDTPEDLLFVEKFLKDNPSFH